MIDEELRSATAPRRTARDRVFGFAKAPDEREQAITNLRQLHGLRQSGVLSESEFNMEKWDVPSRS